MRTFKRISGGVIFLAGIMCCMIDPEFFESVWQVWVCLGCGLGLMATGFAIWASEYESKARKQRRKLAERRKAA